MSTFRSQPQPICLRDGELYYLRNFLQPALADDLYRTLREQVQWEQHVIKVFGKEIPCPRLSAWYGDEDAVYTYHFYRLIQRAKNVYIIYNTEPDVLNGGEKSRFITQLEIEGIHNLTQTIVTPKTPRVPIAVNIVPKTKAVINKGAESFASRS